MSRPGIFNLDLYRGDSYGYAFRMWIDDAGDFPWDISTATAKAEIRDQPGGVEIATADCTIVPPNIVRVELVPDDWADLTFLSGVWDLQLTLPVGIVFTVIRGKVTVTPDVTDSPPSTTAEEVGMWGYSNRTIRRVG